MVVIGDMILRVLAVCLALLAAIFAAGLFISLGFHEQVQMTAEERDSIMPFTLPAGGMFMAMGIGMVAYVPAVIAIAIAEVFRWRGVVMNLALGALVAIYAGYRQFGVGFGQNGEVTADARGASGTLIVVLAAGFVGAFVYWLLAGRNAGKWLDRRRLTCEQHETTKTDQANAEE